MREVVHQASPRRISLALRVSIHHGFVVSDETTKNSVGGIPGLNVRRDFLMVKEALARAKRNYESRTADIVNFARCPSMTAMTLPCAGLSSSHIHWIILSVCHLEERPWE